MTGTADRVEALANALDQAHTVVVGIRADQASASTPCRSWDVATLTGHVLTDLEQFTRMARGEDADFTAGPAEVAPEDWPAEFEARSAARCIAAARRDRASASDSREAVIGLVRTSSMPASSLSCLEAADACAVTATSCKRRPLSRSALRMRRATAMPSSRGSSRSSSATSCSPRVAAANAASPSLTTSTR